MREILVERRCSKETRSTMQKFRLKNMALGYAPCLQQIFFAIFRLVNGSLFVAQRPE